MVIGMVKINKMGFKKLLSTMRTRANIKADEKPIKSIPGSRYSAIKMEIAEIKMRRKKFFI